MATRARIPHIFTPPCTEWEARFLTLACVSCPNEVSYINMERRRHRRVHAQLKSWICTNTHEVEGETIDLSIGGAKFESPRTVEPGDQVIVKLVIPGGRTPIYIEHAQVQWIQDQTFGVRFLEVQQQELDELEQLIDEYLALDEGEQA